MHLAHAVDDEHVILGEILVGPVNAGLDVVPCRCPEQLGLGADALSRYDAFLRTEDIAAWGE